MSGLDWFTADAQLRAIEIYLSFHPDEKPTYEKKIEELQREIKEA